VVGAHASSGSQLDWSQGRLMPVGQSVAVGLAQVKVRVTAAELAELKALASKERVPVNQLLRSVIARELAAADSASGSLPDESAVREMAILIAVELVLKLQETSIPGGSTLSRRLLEDAARSAIERIESVGLSLQRDAAR
jgi:hypothetical protein